MSVLTECNLILPSSQFLAVIFSINIVQAMHFPSRVVTGQDCQCHIHSPLLKQ